MMKRFGFMSQFSAAIAFAIILGVTLSAVYAQDQAKPKEGETKAVAGINAAADATAKLTAAEAFVKKYPKSSLRPEVANVVASEISRVTDPAQKISLGERFLKTFTGDAESERMRAIVIDEYVRAKRGDDAFALGATALAKQPEDVGVLALLAMVGADEVRQQNPKHGTLSMQYGVKAIELIEANKKPANMDEENWKYQKSLLPTLYRDTGMLALASGNPADARPRLEKAIQLAPNEPAAYVFLGGLIDDEYRAAAEAYQGVKEEGPAKQAALKKATDLMDRVIDLYAHALGAASGRAEYKPMYDQVLESLTPYYRYRYKSTTGLQALIDKYKAPAPATP